MQRLLLINLLLLQLAVLLLHVDAKLTMPITRDRAAADHADVDVDERVPFEQFDGRLPLAVGHHHRSRIPQLYRDNWQPTTHHRQPNPNDPHLLDEDEVEEDIARRGVAQLRAAQQQQQSATTANKRGEAIRTCGMLLVHKMEKLCAGCIAPPAGTEKVVKRGDVRIKRGDDFVKKCCRDGCTEDYMNSYCCTAT